jgi:hypothetical protein
MKVLLILILIAVIVVIGWFVARNRHPSSGALPSAGQPESLGTGDFAGPVGDPHTTVHEASPLDPLIEPEPVASAAPQAVTETAPPVEPEPVIEPPLPEPDPIVEPEPPAEPEPVIEPVPPPAPQPEPFQPDAPTAFEAGTEPAGTEPAEAEPFHPEHLAEPEPEPVGTPHGDPLATDAAVSISPVVGEDEVPAEDLDPHAGWETEDDRTIHADPESGLFHTPDSPGYNVGPTGVVFESEDAARTAGFTRWDETN